MLIIQCDNYNRENKSESVIARDVPECFVEIIVDALRASQRLNDEFWCRAEPDDYKPYKYEP